MYVRVHLEWIGGGIVDYEWMHDWVEFRNVCLCALSKWHTHVLSKNDTIHMSAALHISLWVTACTSSVCVGDPELVQWGKYVCTVLVPWHSALYRVCWGHGLRCTEECYNSRDGRECLNASGVSCSGNHGTVVPVHPFTRLLYPVHFSHTLGYQLRHILRDQNKKGIVKGGVGGY